jgi:hypothetical protein
VSFFSAFRRRLRVRRASEPFVPPGYVSVGMATVIAFAVDCHEVTWEREHEEREREQKEGSSGSTGSPSPGALSQSVDPLLSARMEERGNEPAPAEAAGPWTRPRIEEALVEAYRQLHQSPIYSPVRKSDLGKSDPSGVGLSTNTPSWVDPQKAKVRVPLPFDLLDLQNAVYIVVNEELSFRLVPPLIGVRGDDWLPHSPEASLRRLRRALSAQRLCAYALADDGRVTEVPHYFWNTDQAIDVLWRDTTARFHIEERTVRGRVVLRFADLERYCTWPGETEPLVHTPVDRDDDDDDDDDDEGEGDVPSNAGDPGPARGAAGTDADPPVRRRAPDRLRAQRALAELYPDGVPGPDVLSNSDLDRLVNAHLTKKDLRPVSKWTVLRAAGRSR